MWNPFKATLEEAVEADFLIHVLDITHPKVMEHYEITNQVLEELGAIDKPSLLVLNKVDLPYDAMVIGQLRNQNKYCYPVSTHTGEGIDSLLKAFADHFVLPLIHCTLRIPVDRYDLVGMLHREGDVHEERHEEEGVWIDVSFPERFSKNVPGLYERADEKINESDEDPRESDWSMSFGIIITEVCMESMIPSPNPTRWTRYLFWILLGSLSAYLAKCLQDHSYGLFTVLGACSSSRPFIRSTSCCWAGWCSLCPPRLSTLYMAGVLFGLYEAYMTKVIWLPFWLDPDKVFRVAGIAFSETIVIIFVWHPLMSFILPLLLAESQCTATRETAGAMPRLLRGRWVTPRKRSVTTYGFALFLGLFLSGAMKAEPPEVLIACVLSALVPLGLIYLFRKRYPACQYSMRSLLPHGREVVVLAGLLFLMYLWMGFKVRPEVIPGVMEGQLTAWVLYAVVIGLLGVGLFQSSRLKPPPPVSPRHGWLSLKQMAYFALILGLTASFSRAIMGKGTGIFVLAIWLFFIVLAFVLSFMTIRELIRNNDGNLKRRALMLTRLKRNSVKFILTALAIWGTLVFLFVLAVTLAAAGSQTPETMQDYANGRAIILMASGLILFWIVIGGILMVHWREPIRAWVLAIPLNWRVKFVLFCTLLACLEEVVTTSMTNLAPFFGGEIGKSFITASTNYFQVICFNSVIVFIPMFVAWAIILSYYTLKPSTVLLLFGLTGTLAETQYGGPQNLLAVGMWTYVYGLMIYLPAYSLPERPKARPVTYRNALVVFLMAMVLPFLCAIPLVPIVIWVKSLGFQFGPQFVP